MLNTKHRTRPFNAGPLTAGQFHTQVTVMTTQHKAQDRTIHCRTISLLNTKHRTRPFAAGPFNAGPFTAEHKAQDKTIHC